jgi:hypothetical protein
LAVSTDGNGSGAASGFGVHVERSDGIGSDSAAWGWMAAEVNLMLMKKTALATLWHFECPGCGFTDAEIGHPASAETIHCEICLEEGQRVRLKRWLANDSGDLTPRRAA